MSIALIRRVFLPSLTSLTLVMAGAGISHALTEASRQPVDWQIRSTFMGPKGEDVPLRIGQHDDLMGEGFGVRHIIDGHDEVPDDRDIVAVLDRPDASCEYDGSADKWECHGDAGPRGILLIAFTERVDSRSGDGRPVGMVTAFYAPRGCGC